MAKDLPAARSLEAIDARYEALVLAGGEVRRRRSVPIGRGELRQELASVLKGVNADLADLRSQLRVQRGLVDAAPPFEGDGSTIAPGFSGSAGSPHPVRSTDGPWSPPSREDVSNVWPRSDPRP